MKYGKLQVTTDYGDGFTSSATYKVYYFVNEGIDVTCLVDVNSVYNSAQFFYDVDATTNPQGIFGSAENVTFTWTEQPTVVGRYINHGENLDTYTEPGVYCRALSASDSNIISNCPPMMYSSTFVLEVIPAGSAGQIVQRATRCHKTVHVVAERVYYGGSWGEWNTISMNGQKVLWSGSSFMKDGNTATLNDTVSNQANGIILVFSAYADGEAKDTTWQFKFIPKHFVTNNSGQGVSVILGNSCLDKVGTKYLWVYNDRITGHENNDNTGTGQSGITYCNNFFVLRYVLGA